MKVLVVDDNTTSRSALVFQLKNLGFPTEEASNGREALCKVYEGKYKVIFMDIAMPDMDGYEAAQSMRSFWDNNGMSAIPILGVTTAVDKHRCLASGMTDAFVKPITYEDLQSIVQRFLSAQN